MASLFRRAGAELLKLIESSTDPAAVANRAFLYAKDFAAVSQIFARASDGTIYQITPNAAYRYRELAASGNALITDEILVVAGNAAAVTVTLPLAAAVPAGQRLCVKDGSGTANTKPLTVARAGADLIDGETSAIVTIPYGSLDLVSDGVSAWRII
jgi:hypothetical protein